MKTVALFVLLAFCTVLAAEGQKPAPLEEPKSESTIPENEDVFRVSLPDFQPRFNPQLSYTSSEAQLYVNLYEGLIANNPRSLRPEPGLAESWEISEDQLTYRFTLRKNLRFSDGTPLTAQDFVNSWLHLLDPDRQFAFASLLSPIRGVSAYLEGKSNKAPLFRAEGPRTLVITLEQPSPQILSVLGHHSLAPIPRRVLEIDDWSTLPPEEIPSSGAYRVSSHQKGKVELVANPYYHDADKLSFLKAEFILSDDDDWLVQQFNRGNIDWVTNNVSLEQLENDAVLQVSPLFVTTFIYFRSDQPVWRDARVRQALLMLLPLDSLRRDRYADHTLVPPMPGYPRAKEVQAGSRSKAFELLKEAGYPEGKGLPRMVMRVDSRIKLSDDSPLGIVKNAWEDAINLGIEIVPVSDPTSQESLKSEFGLGMLSWIGDYPDPMAFLQLWQGDSSLNFFGYQDKEFDRLVALANTFVGQERLQKLAVAEEYLLDSAALLPISHSPAVNFIDTKRFSGWSDNVLDSHPIRYFKRFRQLPSNSI